MPTLPCPPVATRTGRLLCGLLALVLALAAGPAAAQAATRARTPEPSAQPADSALAWSRLSARQQAALQPLAPVWNQIGPNRKRALLLHFGTAGKVRAAALDDLKRVPGISAGVAQKIYDFYHAGG